MKRFITLTAILLTFGSFLFGQTQRLVLLEHFTQASCGPCATYNPAMQLLLDANPNKVIAIKYQTSWPGYDPMNQHNPTQVASRVSYYPPSFGVPHSQIDGSYFRGHPANWNINTINTRYAVPSPFKIQLSHSLSALKDSVHTKMVIIATQSVSGTMVGHIVVIEKLISFATAPGTNGEKEFRNVMKKMLPSANGTSLPASFAVGDSVVIRESWKLANVYDIEELAVVGFVQDNTSKFVHQAAYSPPLPPTPQFTRDISVLDMTNIPKSSCWGQIAPNITIKNWGGDTLKSLDFNYQVNGGTTHVYTWTGNLPFYAETSIALPMIQFPVIQSNNVLVYTSNPNGQPDELPETDTIKAVIPMAATATQVVNLTLRTDNYPQQTTWQLTDGFGTVLYSGGPYSTPQAFIRDTFYLNPTGCYTFTINDAGGDGICCSTGTGFYRLTDANGANFIAGGTFQSQEISEFDIGNSIGIKEWQAASFVEVYPNPFRDESTVLIDLPSSMQVEVALYDLMGKRVLVVHTGNMEQGTHYLSLNASNFQQGFYLLKVKSGDQFSAHKLQIIR